MVAHGKARGGSVRAWVGNSPPATPLRSPSCTEFGSTAGSGIFGASGSLDAAVSCSTVLSTSAPASLPPPQTSPTTNSRPKSQSLLATPEPRPQPSHSKKRPSVTQIMTLTHPDQDDKPPEQELQEQQKHRKHHCLAAPVVCGAPVRAAQSPQLHGESGGPIRRRNRPTSSSVTELKAPSQPQSVEQQRRVNPRTLSPPPLLAALERAGSSPIQMVQVRQGPAAQSTVSPVPCIVRGDAPLERNTHDVILTGPNAGAKATHCREYTESGIGLDYIPPKYGTTDWEDMATLQGKTRREAEFARRQREKARNDRLEQFEKDRQGFVATLEAENDSRVEAARQRQLQLYKKWDRDVFQRIQQQVMQGVDAIDQKELEHRLRRQSEEYVESISRKDGWVFLEPSDHRDRQRIAAAQRGTTGNGRRSGGVRYRSNDLIDPLKDEQNRLVEERAIEEELERQISAVNSTGRWSLDHALCAAGVLESAAGRGTRSHADHLDRALTTTTRPVHWELDYELGTKVGGGALGGRRECLPRWDNTSKPLHEWSVDSPAAFATRRANGEVRLSASIHARDGAASAGRWAVPDYSGARIEMLRKEVAAAAAATGDTSVARKPVGRQQQTTAPILPDHYNTELASAATHRQEHVAVNGRGKKLGPYGPLGGPPPVSPAGNAGRPPAPPPNILL